MDQFEIDKFNTPINNKELDIICIKHGSLAFIYEGKVIYIDPVSYFADYRLLPKADFIFVTHEHGDHFDTTAIRYIHKAETIIISNKDCFEKLNGYNNLKMISNGESIKFNDWLNVEAVPAHNKPDRHCYHPPKRDNGFIFTIDGLRIYVAGDTEPTEEMKNNIKNIDIAFLPVNQPYTMDIEQAKEAVLALNPKIFIPYHYGSTEIEKLVRLLENSKIDVRVRQLQ